MLTKRELVHHIVHRRRPSLAFSVVIPQVRAIVMVPNILVVVTCKTLPTNTDAHICHREVLNLLSAHDIVFALSRANVRFTSLLEHYELVDEEKEIKCYATNRQAVAEYYSDKGPSTGREAGLVSDDILPTPSDS